MTDQKLSTNCNCTPVYDAQYEADKGKSPVVAVAEALATVKGVEPLEMDPLYDVIDVEALNRLFKDHDDPTETTKALSVTVGGWNVFIRNDGSIRVCNPDVPAASAPVFEKSIGD